MLWGIIICLGFLALIYTAFLKLPFFKTSKLSTSILCVAFLLKLAGAIALFLIYSYYYQDRASADIFKYYDDAVLIFEDENWQISKLGDLFQKENDRSTETISILQDTQHWDQQWHILPNDNRLMILVNLFLLYISQGFYLFHLLFFAFLSFIGSIALFHFFSSLINLGSRLLLAILILPPSSLLWTSGMLKESIFLFAFGLLLFTIYKLKNSMDRWLIPLFLLMLGLSIWVKSYLLICFTPALLLYLSKDSLKLRFNLLLTFFSLLIAMLILWPSFEASLNEQLQRFTELALEIEANTYFPIDSIDGFGGFIMGVPEAIYNVWIRPIMMWDAGLFSLINAIESTIYLVLPFILIPFARSNGNKRLLITMLISFILLASIIIGSSIPVMGAVLRYRSPLLPFYILLLFTFVDTNKLKHQLFRHEVN